MASLDYNYFFYERGVIMLEKAFDEYVSHYNMNNMDIKLKYTHSYRVMKLQEKYAKLLGFSKEDIELARVIGLLHDLGRFEQLRVYKTYDDSKSIDHALYSCVQLFEKGEIKKFVSNEEWYPIIEFAIKNHNKRVLEKVADERMMMHAKLIRDTDKIDIIYLMGALKEINIIPVKRHITKEVWKEFFEHKEIDKKWIKNKNDYSVVRYGFAFDINNTICLKELKKNYDIYHEIQKDNEELTSVYEETIRYIKERLKDEGIR